MPATVPTVAPATAAGLPPKPAWNPWPYALIAVFAVFISFVAAAVILAGRQRVDLVRPDYYDQEIRYQQQIDRLARTAVPGVDVDVAFVPATRELRLVLPSRHAAGFGGGTVSLYRPSDARQDREVAFAPASDGSQSIPLPGLEPGLWKVRVAWKAGGAEYFHEQSLSLPAKR